MTPVTGTVMSTVPAPTITRADLPRRPPAELLAAARHGLTQAAITERPAERFALAHLAALRAAACVLAVRAVPAPSSPGRPARGRRPASAWRLLAVVAPELGEWAAFFAAGAAKRAAAEAGMPGAVTVREADDLLREAEAFLTTVTASLQRIGPASTASPR